MLLDWNFEIWRIALFYVICCCNLSIVLGTRDQPTDLKSDCHSSTTNPNKTIAQIIKVLPSVAKSSRRV